MRRIVTILIIVLIPIIIGSVIFLGYRMGWWLKSSTPANPKEYTYSVGDFTINLDDPSYKRYMKVTVYVGSTSKKLNEEITEKMPMIRDTIIGVLRSKKIDDVNSPSKTDGVKREIRDKLNSVFTSGKVINVYLNDILIQ